MKNQKYFLKIFLSSLMIFCLATILSSFSLNKIEFFTGTIKFYGNAPKQEVAFVSENGKLYALEVSENPDFLFTLEDIISTSGKKIELCGKLNKENPKLTLYFKNSGTIEVQSFKIFQ